MQLCVLLVSASVCFYFNGSYRCEQLRFAIIQLLIARLHSRSLACYAVARNATGGQEVVFEQRNRPYKFSLYRCFVLFLIDPAEKPTTVISQKGKKCKKLTEDTRQGLAFQPSEGAESDLVD